MTQRRYGRRAPHSPQTHPRLRLGSFLNTGHLPPIPATVDYLSHVTDWPMYLNSDLGDCTCAAAGHMIEAWTAYGQGETVEVTNNDVLKAYGAVSGYVPGNASTDQGANMQDVLGYWRRTGVGGHKILAFAELDVKNPAEVQAALYLFGAVYVGLNVPASAETQFDAGQDWDVVTNDGGNQGGHAVNLGARDATGRLKLVTWGAVQAMSQAFWDAYVEEAWVAVSQDWVNANGTSPEGLDVQALGEAFTALTGEPNPFPVAPSPVPPAPTPSPVDPSHDADLALVTAAGRWALQRHIGVNEKVAQAITRWRASKGI